MYRIYKPVQQKRVFYQRPIGKRKPLNTNDPRVQELSEKYNIALKTVAYIRAAMNGGRYNKETLIKHIEIENGIRYKAIEEHKVSTRFSQEQKEDLIKYTMINIKFREGVVETLNTLGLIQLTDILS